MPPEIPPAAVNIFAIYTPPANVAEPVVPVCSKVPGCATTDDAPVPPSVSSVVAPANAVNDAPEFNDVVNVGDVPNTNTPEPVSSVTAVAKFALLGVPRNVKIPVPVVVVLGDTPAPPPIIKAFAAKRADVAHVEALEK